jgi:hypothetical protein
MSTLNFCTLFDRHYLTRGLALYNSLLVKCADFHLYVFAFDQDCYHTLQALKLSHCTVISLLEFEDPELLSVKASRSIAEYCWTSTPSTILYCIDRFQLDHCTYIDADLIFYQDPRVLIDEMGENEILISKHNYATLYDQSEYSGIYCVQFMCFKNGARGMKALRWWRERCLEWCYARHEDGKFGDQKYLDDWTTRFEGVHVMQHIGGGVAPWNMQQFEFEQKEDSWWLKKQGDRTFQPLIFFHFHGVVFHLGQTVSLTGALYYMSNPVRTGLYFPYLHTLLQVEDWLASKGLSAFQHGARKEAPSQSDYWLTYLKQHLQAYRKHPFAAFQWQHWRFDHHYHLIQIPEANGKSVNSIHG